MLFRVLLLTAVGAWGQARFEALKDALGLTEMQIWQIQQPKPVAIVPSGIASAARRPGIPFNPPMDYSASLDRALQNPILDASQQAGLAEIVKVLKRWNMASEAIVAGLIDARQWPGSTLCLYPLHVFASELHLSDAQVAQLETFRRAAREPLETQIAEKEKARAALPDPKSPAVIELTADISKLRQQLAVAAPPRNLALAILNDAQKVQLAALETALQLVSEAIDLKLIPDPPKGEPLCQ
jgi:hypothetical protein